VTSSSTAQRLPSAERSIALTDRVARLFADSRAGELLFAALVSLFCIIYLLYYPASYSILDESSTLELSYALAHGTIYLERVGLSSGLVINGHVVSLYSPPFHAALLVPGLLSEWRLGFAVKARRSSFWAHSSSGECSCATA
jgi:hypothetical protein